MSGLANAPLEATYWVEYGRFLAGRRPGLHLDDDGTRAELAALCGAGAELFVDLTEGREYGLRPYEGFLAAPAEHRRMPVPDFGCPTIDEMRAILDAIEGALAAGRGVYVHCYAGIGRTGTVVACHLVRGGMEAAEAMRTVSGWRGVRSPQSAEQDAFVRAWHAGA